MNIINNKIAILITTKLTHNVILYIKMHGPEAATVMRKELHYEGIIIGYSITDFIALHFINRIFGY